MRRTRKVRSDTSAVGAIGELSFASEAASRGCLPFVPVGSVSGIDLLLLTPTGKRLTIQVKAQATDRRFSIDLKTGLVADVLVLLHAKDGWHLIPAEDVGKRKIVNRKFYEAYNDCWEILK